MNVPGTETPNDLHPDLDRYDVPELVDAFVDDQGRAVDAVRAARTQIAAAISAAIPRIAGGGRLVYVGAGTSGRLGLMDSVELFPTFSWPKDRAIALLAGGERAVREAVEGAEDSDHQGREDIAAAQVSARDVVILVAASGGTPYVLGALSAARALGALTIGISNNPGAAVVARAEHGITLDTGPEVISGSTRLKAGTAQKIVLNTLSSAVMVKLHKVHGNLMVDLKATNAKLVARAVRLTCHATGADETRAREALAACDFHVKTAIVALARSVSAQEARALLDAAGGSVRQALS